MNDFRSHPPAMHACDVCGEERPLYLVQITRHDVSEQVGLEADTVERRVRHCSDRRECVEAAEDPDNWRIIDDRLDAWAAAEAIWRTADDGVAAASLGITYDYSDRQDLDELLDLNEALDQETDW